MIARYLNNDKKHTRR